MKKTIFITLILNILFFYPVETLAGYKTSMNNCSRQKVGCCYRKSESKDCCSTHTSFTWSCCKRNSSPYKNRANYGSDINLKGEEIKTLVFRFNHIPSSDIKPFTVFPDIPLFIPLRI